jgi:hypothetical protein
MGGVFTSSLSWLFLGLLASPTFALEKYLCVAEQSTGFKWDGSNWVIAKFKVDDGKYVVREVEEYDFLGDNINYEVLKLGEESPKHHCFRSPPDKTPTNSKFPKPDDRMACGGFGLMSFDTLRYQEYWGHGYVGNDLRSTPNITVGKCSKIE